MILSSTMTRTQRIQVSYTKHLAGQSMQSIAAELGVHRNTVAHDIEVAADLMPSAVTHRRRQINFQRLESIYYNLQPALTSDDPAIVIGASGQAIRALLAQSRLLGLDEPTRTEHTITNTTVVSIEIRALVEQVQAANLRARALIAGHVEQPATLMPQGFQDLAGEVDA